MEESWKGQNGGIHSEAIKNKETKDDKMSTPPPPLLILSLRLTNTQYKAIERASSTTKQPH